MGNATALGTVTIAGMGFPFNISVTDEGSILQDVTVEKGYDGDTVSGTGTKAGRVDTDTAIPDITTDDYVDIYWDGGVLYNADVSAVANDNEITFLDTNGLGDNLPADGTPVVISVRSLIVTEFLGTDVSCLAASCSGDRCHISYVDNANPTTAAELHAVDIAAAEGWFWIEGMGFTNPITGDTVSAIYVSTSDVGADQTFSVGVLYDSVS